MEDPEDLPSLLSLLETTTFDSQQTCGIPDVQEFLPSTTWDWGQDSYPDQKVNVASTKVQAEPLHGEYVCCGLSYEMFL